jgi:hypothetical protein
MSLIGDIGRERVKGMKRNPSICSITLHMMRNKYCQRKMLPLFPSVWHNKADD